MMKGDCPKYEFREYKGFMGECKRRGEASGTYICIVLGAEERVEKWEREIL